MATKRGTVFLDEDQLGELRAVFHTIDEDGSGHIEAKELQAAFKAVGLSIPAFEVRNMMSKYDREDRDGKLSLEEFQQLYIHEKHARDAGTRYKKNVKTKEGLDTLGGTSSASSEGTTHSVKLEEQKAFAGWINRSLKDDKDCEHLLPLSEDGKDLYQKVKDGILLCKLINHSVPNTIDERAINKGNLNVYRKHENLMLAVGSAAAIGCSTVNIGAEDVEKGKPHLVLGLLWQIIRIGLLNDINLAHFPSLVNLLEEGETIEDLRKLSPEQILLRWVNYHLRRSGYSRTITNFGDDIKDSEAYTYLLHQIAPSDKDVTLNPLAIGDLHSRAEGMLQEAEKIGCRSFLGPQDVVDGNQKLNLAFVANLFNNYPALDQTDCQQYEQIEETREEKTYRNWMNSLGVQPHVYHLYSDLGDGLVIFQLYDHIEKGRVDWKRVKTTFNRMRVKFEKIENCNYAVELHKDVKIVKIKADGTQGTDIHEGNSTFTLGLVWQLMRAYTLAILRRLTDPESSSPIQESEIIEWVNSKLRQEGFEKINSFRDESLKDSMKILKLIEVLKPGCVKWDVVKKDAANDEELLSNARYAIALARKIGAGVYALPEDIVEKKPKMMLTVFACLMTLDLGARNVTGGLKENDH